MKYSFYIFDEFVRETSRLYHTTIETNSLKDLLTKFAKWDMAGDDEAIKDLLAEVHSDKDAKGYFDDRGSVILEANSVEEF